MLLAVATESPIKVDVDATTLVQLVLFVVLTLILKPILFDPMLKLFEERERRIDGAKLQARQTDERSAHALADYEAGISKARATANTEREAIRAEALEREAEILHAVRAATAKVIDDGKRAMQIETEKARADLEADAPRLARELATRVLGREVQS